MEKTTKEERLKTILEEARKIGLDSHPGFKDALDACFAWGLNMDNVSVKTDNEKLIIVEKIPFYAYHNSNAELVGNIAVIEKKNDNLEVRLAKEYMGYKLGKNTDGSEYKETEQEFIGFAETRIIDKNGIEVQRMQEVRNVDNVLTSKTTVERRGLKEVYYTKDINGEKYSGIGGIEYNPNHREYFQKITYYEAMNKPIEQPAVSEEILKNCLSNLNEKQREGLMQLDNSAFVVRKIEVTNKRSI